MVILWSKQEFKGDISDLWYTKIINSLNSRMLKIYHRRQGNCLESIQDQWLHLHNQFSWVIKWRYIWKALRHLTHNTITKIKKGVFLMQIIYNFCYTLVYLSYLHCVSYNRKKTCPLRSWIQFEIVLLGKCRNVYYNEGDNSGEFWGFVYFIKCSKNCYVFLTFRLSAKRLIVNPIF